jgi:hypothetical protein
LLKLRLVACENWDLFAVLEGRQGRSKKQAQKAPAAGSVGSPGYARSTKAQPRGRRKVTSGTRPVTSIVDPGAAALRAIREHLDFGEVEAALAVHRKQARSRPDWELAESDCRDLTQALLDQNAWEDAASVMRDHLHSATLPSPRIRLKLAQILIQELSRPLAALKVLDEIPEGSLSESLEDVKRKLVRQATAMQEDEEGPLEFQDELG